MNQTLNELCIDLIAFKKISNNQDDTSSYQVKLL